jgi:hypothetical protein
MITMMIVTPEKKEEEGEEEDVIAIGIIIRDQDSSSIHTSLIHHPHPVDQIMFHARKGKITPTTRTEMCAVRSPVAVALSTSLCRFDVSRVPIA